MLRIRFILPALLLALSSGALAQNIGASFCSPTNNSTGVTTTLVGTAGNGTGGNLHLEIWDGVAGEFGYLLAGNEATAGVPLSNGMICLIGTGTARVYRYNIFGGGFNSIGQFDAAGRLQNHAGTSTLGSGFDVPGSIPDTVPVSIMSGDTWHFQFWHRDTPAGQGTSNFSNGLSVTFPVVAPVTPITGMVQIPAGAFDMGSNEPLNVAPYYNRMDSQPVHRVTISQSFWMGEHEVTQAEYQAMMGSNPSFFLGPNLPVDSITWHVASAYCAALTAQEMAAGNLSAGYEYRLPTEAEWEYACRAGTTTEFNVSADLFCADARFDSSNHSGSSCSISSTTAVGSYSANAFGLYDMHGNVWEWCLDFPSTYTAGAVTDPFADSPVMGGWDRMLRGGSYWDPSYRCRSAFRTLGTAASAFPGIGFRVVLGSVLGG